jgi:hypothetical protein
MALTVFITSASDVLPWAARRIPSLASVVIPFSHGNRSQVRSGAAAGQRSR